MIESERNASSDNRPPEGNPPRSVSTSLIALLLLAVAVVAGTWYFYQQDARDAATGNTEAVPAATQDATTPSDTVASTNDSTTATTDDTAQPAATEAGAMNTDTIVVHRSSLDAKAKPAAKKRSLASLAKPSRSVVALPDNRDVNREVALLDTPNPAYPREALREHEEGTVLVLAQVDVQGRVSDAHVIEHSGWTALDRAAMNEVRNWKFQPALQNGKPVIASVQVPVSYRLDQ